MSWRQGQAYSRDLRDRILAAVDGGLGVYAAAPLFRVSVSYIYKALIRRWTTGETTARPQRCHVECKLAAYDEAITRRVAALPDATLEELRTWLLATHGVSISSSGMWTTLDRLGLTLKKSRATRRSRSARTSLRTAPTGAPSSRTWQILSRGAIVQSTNL